MDVTTTGGAAERDALAELLADAYAMAGGTGMMRRYAGRQGWICATDDTDAATHSAAVFLAAAGRTFADVLRAAS